MGIQPAIWGPYLWTALHLICEGAPLSLDDAQRQHYRAFFEHLAHVLPCEKCADHLQQLLVARPLGNDVMTRQHLIDWCIGLHNDVSRDIAGPQMSLDDARHHWAAVAAGKKAPFPSVCNHCGAAGASGASAPGAGMGRPAGIVLAVIVIAALAYVAVYAMKSRSSSSARRAVSR